MRDSINCEGLSLTVWPNVLCPESLWLVAVECAIEPLEGARWISGRIVLWPSSVGGGRYWERGSRSSGRATWRGCVFAENETRRSKGVSSSTPRGGLEPINGLDGRNGAAGLRLAAFGDAVRPSQSICPRSPSSEGLRLRASSLPYSSSSSSVSPNVLIDSSSTESVTSGEEATVASATKNWARRSVAHNQT